MQKKVAVIPPPVELPNPTPVEVALFRNRFNMERPGPYIAMAARFAAEKGVEVLLDAFPRILEHYPGARILFAGQHRGVLGEDAYYARLAPLIDAYARQDQWRFLGVLTQREMACFFRSVDLLCVPSLNSTESFGLVQIEAMMNGTPAVASDLPGVRQPVRMTGMGRIAPVGNPDALAAAVLDILPQRDRFRAAGAGIAADFAPSLVAARYVQLFEDLCRKRIRQPLQRRAPAPL